MKAGSRTALAMTVALAWCAAAQAETTIIHAGTLLAVPGSQPTTEQSVIVIDGVISEIRDGFVSADEMAGSPTIVDLSSQFVMPGFIDLHVHLSSDAEGSARDQYVRKPDAYFALVGADNARRTLLAGFTTVRDLGSRGHSAFGLRDAIKDGRVPGPKMLVAGSSITPTGGHGDFHGYREEVARALPAAGTCDGADDCRRAVREAVKRGADVIKVTSTGGVLSNTNAGTGQQFTLDELKAIAETAHALGRKVTAHAHAKEGIEAALEAGFDSIEHSMWADEGTMRAFKKADAWLIPTVYPITYVGETEEALRRGPFKDVPPNIMTKLIQLGKQPKAMTRLAYDMGVKIALGTDSGVSPHGENANEFVEYVNVGMTPMEALVAGTVNAAKAGGIEGVGTLEPGNAADLVALPRSPLEDIRAVLEVEFVMRDGIIFKGPGATTGGR